MSANRPNQRDEDAATGRTNSEHADSELVRHACQKLAQHSQLRTRAASFDFHKLGDVLVVRGRVPSFYLKQMVQTALKDLEGVRRIDNQVQVVASHGLSSLPEP